MFFIKKIDKNNLYLFSKTDFLLFLKTFSSKQQSNTTIKFLK